VLLGCDAIAISQRQFPLWGLASDVGQSDKHDCSRCRYIALVDAILGGYLDKCRASAAYPRLRMADRSDYHEVG
jgi:hypothetical protein